MCDTFVGALEIDGQFPLNLLAMDVKSNRDVLMCCPVEPPGRTRDSRHCWNQWFPVIFAAKALPSKNKLCKPKLQK